MTNRSLAVFVIALMVCGSVAGGVGATGVTEEAGATGEQTASASDEVRTAAEPTIIASCTAITEPGRYELVGDIENSSADACIEIRASDVVLDGNGHAIDGVIDLDGEAMRDRFFRLRDNPLESRTDVGVRVAADRTLSNVTVRDLTLTDWRWGVLAEDLRDGRIAGVRATDGGIGVAATASRNVEVTDVTADENAAFGVGLFGVERSAVENVTASENAIVGVYLSGGTRATVAEVTARNNDFGGVLLDGAAEATVRDVTAAGSRFGVYFFQTSDVEVTRTTAVENSFAGLYAVGATRATITDSEATNNDLAGVLLQETSEVEVTTTNASRNRYGIYLFEATDTTVRNSTGNDEVVGVYVRNSSGGAVLNNTVLDNSFTGVYLDNSTDVRVADNRDGTITFESTDNETIGKEGGYRHDSTIDVNQSDGLSDEELEAYVYRAIARAEHLRQLEYEGEVSFELISRAELERRNANEPPTRGPVSAWENQLWEALFVAGEDENATTVLGNESTRVGGYYNAYADKLVIVSQDDDPLKISSSTLVHEFVHALQDQHFDLTRGEFRPRTEDASRAQSGLVEGDARYADERFEEYCGVVWNCVQVESKDPRGGDISDARNFGLRAIVLAPYSDGPGYVAQLRDRGGWEAVNEAYENPPNTTEQIIHPDRRNEPPVPLSFEDAARNGWETFDQRNLSFRGVDGTTTMGEAALYAMFWYQGYEYDNEIVDVQGHLVPDGGPYDWYNYTSEPSEGWGNDVFVPYKKEVATENETRYGYVWRTAWDTERDARQFRRAYVDLLGGHGAEQVGPSTWVVESGPFADAFRVVRDGSNVTIVNAPTVEALDDLRPSLGEGNASAGNVHAGKASARSAASRSSAVERRDRVPQGSSISSPRSRFSSASIPSVSNEPFETQPSSSYNRT